MRLRLAIATTLNGQVCNANAIAEVAEKYRITQIVIGESQRSRWQMLLKGSLTQKLVRLLKNIDLHIIASEKMVSTK